MTMLLILVFIIHFEYTESITCFDCILNGVIENLLFLSFISIHLTTNIFTFRPQTGQYALESMFEETFFTFIF